MYISRIFIIYLSHIGHINQRDFKSEAIFSGINISAADYIRGREREGKGSYIRGKKGNAVTSGKGNN